MTTTAGLATGTATSRVAALGVAILTIVLGACGSSSGDTSRAGRTVVSSASSQSVNGAFAWLAPRAAPPSWPAARIASGAVLHYPPGWRRARGDVGTATAVLTEAHGQIVGYLNVTPRQGDETLRRWAAFRVRHNAQEGDRDVRSEAAARGLRFLSGHGACVRDGYATSTNSRYVELACLVEGQHGSSVIVAAASPQAWTALSPLLERAISAFLT